MSEPLRPLDATLSALLRLTGTGILAALPEQTPLQKLASISTVISLAIHQVALESASISPAACTALAYIATTLVTTVPWSLATVQAALQWPTQGGSGLTASHLWIIKLIPRIIAAVFVGSVLVIYTANLGPISHIPTCRFKPSLSSQFVFPPLMVFPLVTALLQRRWWEGRGVAGLVAAALGLVLLFVDQGKERVNEGLGLVACLLAWAITPSRQPSDGGAQRMSFH